MNYKLAGVIWNDKGEMVMRFTRKVNNEHCNYDIKKGHLCDAFNKLGQLEDIEEELGIDLNIIKKSLKALEIIKETPIFAWYITIYKDAYEMIADAKGFRVNESAEELQEKFDLLKEVLGNDLY